MKEMNRTIRTIASLGLLGLLASVSASIGSAQQLEHREAGAHVHGAVDIAIVKTDSNVSVEFRSPLFNVRGFEHPPTTADQTQASAAAMSALKDPQNIVLLTGAAACRATSSAKIELAADHDDDAHESQPGLEHHGHEDLTATYSFSCAAPNQLRDVDITALKTFPRIETANVIYLDEHKQSSGKIKPGSSVFHIR